jgi:hypothetical protein
MAPAPKSSKKTGQAKVKGAQRAKSGCYTCRIRRKKCDEDIKDGQCSTCVRLNLQCLGFGAKRPEWLREQNNVVNLRERIKTFLGSKGLIRGQAAPGSRGGNAVSMLQLVPEDDSSSSSASSTDSPRSQTLSITEECFNRSNLSNIRDASYDGSLFDHNANINEDPLSAGSRYEVSPLLSQGADLNNEDFPYYCKTPLFDSENLL